MTKLTKFKLIDVISVETIPGNKKVYDISVKDDESYSANNLIVHNCTTAANVSINYPLGSLISECYALKKQYKLTTKIVVDGGMRNYSDIIKALALGCFLPTTLVYTKKGFKQIQNVNINDYIYTHTGEYKKVINKFKYENTKDIISINGIFSTSNHRYYVINKKYKNLVTEKNINEYAEWIAAGNLNSEYLLIGKNISLQHQVQMYLKNIFSKIYVIYLKLFKKLHEKNLSQKERIIKRNT